MSRISVVKLRLSLMGRPVRNYTFDKPVVTVGRDPDSDVFVDNPGVSRDHLRLERLENGEYQVVDLGSANGTLVNDRQVHVAPLGNNDVVRFGKYALWIGYDQERPADGDSHRASAQTESHTLVLSRAELDNVIGAAKARESQPVAALPVEQPFVADTYIPPAEPAPLAGVAIPFLLGALVGAGIVWLILRH